MSYRVELHNSTAPFALVDILDEVYEVEFDDRLNQAPTLSFKLPEDDVKWASIAAFKEIWLYGHQDELVNVFRILPTGITRPDRSTALEGSVECMGYASALQDDLVTDELTYTNTSVTTILTALLAYQTVMRVTLGTISASLDKLISVRFGWENVMQAAWAVRNVVGGYVSVEPDSADPTLRKLHLRDTVGGDIGKRIRKGLNLKGISKRSDPSGMVTKLYPLGRGEGVNQQKASTDLLLDQAATFAFVGAGSRSTLVIAGLYSRYKGWTAAGAALPILAPDTVTRFVVKRNAVDVTSNFEQGADETQLRSTTNGYNPGAGTWTLTYRHADYLIADAEKATYGTIARQYTDKRFENSQTLVEAARVVLGQVRAPIVNYTLKAADLAKKYPTETFERLNLGDQVNVYDPDLSLTFKDRIVRVHYGNYADPDTLELELSNGDPVDRDAADLAERQRKYETMPDGATNIWTDIFEDNVDATHPYDRRIYIPSDAVRVNKVTLSFESKPYRYYVSTASAASGGSNQTTAGGGSHSHAYAATAVLTLGQSPGTSDSTTPGATGSDATSESAHTHGMGATGNQNVTHTHWVPAISASTDAEVTNHSHTNSGTGAGSAHSHSHSHTSAGHTHGFTNLHQHGTGNVTYPNFVLDNGTGTTLSTATNHTHTLDTTHTHVITVTPGIVETTTATAVTLTVDGTAVAGTPTSRTDFDLTPYLSRNADGTIVRGWHTVRFTPDQNSRIQGSLLPVVFLQSRGIVVG